MENSKNETADLADKGGMSIRTRLMIMNAPWWFLFPPNDEDRLADAKWLKERGHPDAGNKLKRRILSNKD